jgi:NitT/TauT family transport system permease protein
MGRPRALRPKPRWREEAVNDMAKALKPGSTRLRALQAGLLLALLALWHLASRDPQVAFFFGEPLVVAQRLWAWFTQGSGVLEVGTKDSTWFTLRFPAEIYPHLIITLVETLLAFAIGTVLGLAFGLWLALSPTAAAILDPYITAANSMPRVILAPIFALWFGLGIWSKVALAVTLVFFIVFFNVYQGVKEVSPVVLNNARMLGANRRQLLRHVYVPSATSWVFSSLHTSVGLAFVGAVVGEYLGSARGVGYLILQAEGTFDINTVVAGIVVLTAFALALDAAVSRVERRLMKWQPRSAEVEKI